MLSWLRALTDAIMGKVPGKPDRLDTATRMAMYADFTAERGADARRVDGEAPKVDPIEELRRDH